MEKRIKYGTILMFSLILGISLYGFIHGATRHPTIIAKPDMFITAEDLIRSFERDEALSDSLYLYKSLSVRGIVKKIERDPMGDYIVFLGGAPGLTTSVSCSLDSLYQHHSSPLQKGDSCILIGACAGHLSDVILLGCIIEK